MLVAVAAPVAILVNCLRVFGTGLIMIHAGPQWATGKLHEYEGMIMIGVAALVLVLVAWLMAGMDDWYRERNAAAPPSAESPQPA